MFSYRDNGVVRREVGVPVPVGTWEQEGPESPNLTLERGELIFDASHRVAV